MSWLLLLHIATMICWCGFLLYMPALISISAGQTSLVDESQQDTLPRLFFTLFLTPAALLAITSGTLVFVIQNTTTPWLMVKLTLVSGLVMTHAFNGWLILQMEGDSHRDLNRLCLFTGLGSFILMAAIISLVLSKPDLGYLICAKC
ncbi:CopD family protein [Legionella yabuuchiae]|uniref:CopD family protein n=1 Tax=Legionella yabuuchiae TaxID=376727 RepID=UPI0010566BE1|nr:CopD family protein [Legionella yabuuchiae]